MLPACPLPGGEHTWALHLEKLVRPISSFPCSSASVGIRLDGVSRLWRDRNSDTSVALNISVSGSEGALAYLLCSQEEGQWRMMTGDRGEEKVWGGSCGLGPSGGWGFSSGGGEEQPFLQPATHYFAESRHAH